MRPGKSAILPFSKYIYGRSILTKPAMPQKLVTSLSGWKAAKVTLSYFIGMRVHLGIQKLFHYFLKARHVNFSLCFPLW